MSIEGTHRFRINVKSFRSTTALGPDGKFASSVVFHVKPLDSGQEYDLKDGLVWGERLRLCELLQASGPTTVAVAGTRVEREPEWKAKIVEIALEQVAAQE